MNPTTAAEMAAYPVIGARWATTDYPGLTKRELFAAMAMQGILSNAAILERHGISEASVAQSAVAFADALLAKLAQATP